MERTPHLSTEDTDSAARRMVTPPPTDTADTVTVSTDAASEFIENNDIPVFC